jgi:hypothetical protein
MDLRLFFSVLARFRVVVAIGLLLAVCLALLSYAKISFTGPGPTFSHRGDELWASNARLLVTAPGFSLGKDRPSTGEGEAEGRGPGLAAIYSSFVTGDPVRRIMLREGPVKGQITASPLPAAPGSSTLLPIVNITAFSTTVEDALALGRRAAAALRVYVLEQQKANGVPESRRVELRPLNAAFEPKLMEPRSKTMPIVVFLAVMFTVLSIVFLLENLRPRLRAVHEPRVALGEIPRTETENPLDRAKHTA